MLKRWQLPIALILLWAAPACSLPFESHEESSPAAAQQLPDPRVVQAANSFGLALQSSIMEQQPEDNVILSPISLTAALTMTWNGSSGATRSAMSETLRLTDLTADEINEGNKLLLQALSRNQKGVQLSLANSLWMKKGFQFSDEFTSLNSSYFKSKLTTLDLTSPKAPRAINEWVKKNTNGKIARMVDHPLHSSSVLLLLNTVYLNAQWEQPFSPSATVNGPFNRLDGSSKEVPFMAQTGSFQYKEEDGIQAVRIPYADGHTSMIVVLPKSEADLAKLLQTLQTNTVEWTESLSTARGTLRLPRFKLEFSKSLKEPLISMGMGLAFDNSKADFSKMAPLPPGQTLFIGDVLHNTYLDVTEKGTEAAGSTKIEMRAGSAPPKNTFQMTVDRPFFLAIEEQRTGALLFTGWITNP